MCSQEYERECLTAVYNHWTGLDWTGLDWTTGLPLKLTACQYINTYNVFVQLINGAYSYAACPGIILCCHWYAYVLWGPYILYYVHVCNLCINHRCINNVGMLNQPSGKHSCLRYSTYVLLQMHKLCIDNANSEAIRTDKLIMYMICTLIYCMSLKTPAQISHKWLYNDKLSILGRVQ